MSSSPTAPHPVDPAPAVAPDPNASRKWLLVILLLTGVYSAGYLLWFWETPLGKVPVLDGRENVILARQIADGTLPKEPFFRAMLYPAVLAAPALAGLDDDDMLMVAGALGVLFHLLSTAAVFGCARRLWKQTAPAAVSAALYGLYPPAVYFAAEPLDTTFSLTLLILAIYVAVSTGAALKSEARLRPATGFRLVVCGALAAAAFVARPNFLPVLIVLPVAVLGLCWATRARISAPAIVLAGMLPILGAYGAWQQAVSGKFGVMPWQGGYSLWVANGPDANGRYYAQKSMLAYEGPHQNPARVESESLYRAETGGASTATPLQVDRYWRDKTKAAILADPARWSGLELRKLYYFLNDFEQYNNKTFSFHKSRSPLLNWNVLSWGILFCLASVGCVAAWKVDGKMTAVLLVLATAYLAGGLLVFAGDRFRFPLVPFAAIFAGGAVMAGAVLSTTAQRILGAGAAALALFIAFSRFAGVHDTSTYAQDRMLLANAHLRTGQDAEARALALEVLHEHPDRSDARNIAAAARFNQHLTGARLIQTEEEWRQISQDLAGATATLPGTKWTQAIADWNAGQPEVALQSWRTLVAAGASRASADSLAMLVLSGRATASEQEQLLQLEWQRQSPYVWVARATLEGATFENQITSHIAPANWIKVKETTARLLVRKPVP